MKKIFIGKEGSGKTLLMGRESERVVYRNNFIKRKYAFDRPIVSNIRYSDSFLALAKSKGIEIRQWRNIEELESLTECDLFIDEVGAYFDSRTFANLPLSTRLWLAQAQKLGVHIYGGAQDWAQIDISFRRLVNELVEVRRLFGSRRPSKTLPGSKRPWAIGFTRRLDPASDSESGKLKAKGFLPSLLVMTKADTSRFDTNARVTDSALPPVRMLRREIQYFGEQGTIVKRAQEWAKR